jgi:hypothetical protein
VSQIDIEKPSNDSASDSVQQISITSVDLAGDATTRAEKNVQTTRDHPHLQTDLIVDSEGGKISDSRSFSPDASAHCLPFLAPLRRIPKEKEKSLRSEIPKKQQLRFILLVRPPSL